jgi:hypothetical protein
MLGKAFGCLTTVFALAIAAPAAADSIYMGQFGSDGTVLPNVVSGVTEDGVGFTLTGLGSGFTVFLEGVDWSGQFDPGVHVLFTNVFNHSLSGVVTINFDHPIASISQLFAQANITGTYGGTLNIFDNSTMIGQLFTNSDNELGPEGSLPAFSDFVAPAGTVITSLTLTTTNAFSGIAIGGADVPEPASWAIMVVGFAGLGASLRRRRRERAALA